MKLEIVGTRELTVAINNAHKQAVPQAIKVTKNNTEELRKEAMRRAPRDTDFLHDNIITQYKGMSGEVNAKASYSGYQEFGTRFKSAQPFMFPALKVIQPIYEKEMTDVMKGVFE